MATSVIPTSNAAVPAKTAAAVKKAVTTPGARGAKGFMLWAQAALPPKVLKAVTAAAAKHVPATAPGIGRFGTFSFLGRSRARIGQFGNLGQTGGTAYGTSPGATYAGSTGATAATVAGTPSTAGSTGWANDILQAVGVAGATATTIAAVRNNLQVAQQGGAPYPYTIAPSAAVGGQVLGMSSNIFWFMLLGAGALVYFGDKKK